jgi:hypothetical protein
MLFCMGTVTKRTFIAGVASAALLSGGGAVLLTAPEGSAGEAARPAPEAGVTLAAPPPPGMMMGGHADAVAEYLDMTPEEMLKAHMSGKSLADIAADQGKSVEGLKDVMRDEFEDHLDDMINAAGPRIERMAVPLKGGKRGRAFFDHVECKHP